ncbi:MAG TPA: VOC family protein [Trebonia sp.]|jgi:PhnB protein|nr:VOC family protein [Trebonia sp.]
MTAAKPIPDGYPQVAPYLTIDGAVAAIDFYKDVLGARERLRMPMEGGRIGHAELEIGDSLVMLSDASPELGDKSPNALHGTPVSMMVYVPDVDAVMERAAAAGASISRVAEDQFYGDRLGEFTDPFGHRWDVATHVEDVSEEEIQRRMATMGS